MTLIQNLRSDDKWAYVTQANQRVKQSAQFGCKSAVATIAGFGRDWSRRNAVLRLSVDAASLPLLAEEIAA